MRYAVGIDLGGTFVKFALVSENGDILFDDKLSIGGKALRDDILNTVSKAIGLVIQKAGELNVKVTGIGSTNRTFIIIHPFNN